MLVFSHIIFILKIPLIIMFENIKERENKCVIITTTIFVNYCNF